MYDLIHEHVGSRPIRASVTPHTIIAEQTLVPVTVQVLHDCGFE